MFSDLESNQSLGGQLDQWAMDLWSDDCGLTCIISQAMSRLSQKFVCIFLCPLTVKRYLPIWCLKNYGFHLSSSCRLYHQIDLKLDLKFAWSEMAFWVNWTFLFPSLAEKDKKTVSHLCWSNKFAFSCHLYELIAFRLWMSWSLPALKNIYRLYIHLFFIVIKIWLHVRFIACNVYGFLVVD